MTALTLQPRATAPRCAYCHDALAHEAVTCPDCGTLVHEDCQLDRCPTLGCQSEEAWEWTQLPASGWERRSPWRQPLVLLNLLLVALLGGAWAFEAVASVFVTQVMYPISGAPPFFEPEAHPSLLDPAPSPIAAHHLGCRDESSGGGMRAIACGFGNLEPSRRFTLRTEGYELVAPSAPACDCDPEGLLGLPGWRMRAGEVIARKMITPSGTAFSSDTSGTGWLYQADDPGSPPPDLVQEERQNQALLLPAGVFVCTYRRTQRGWGADRVEVETWTSSGIPVPVQTQTTWRTPGAPGGFPNVRRTVLVSLGRLPSER